MSLESIREAICQEAAENANQMAREQIPQIGAVNTDVFDSFANLEGSELALRMKFSYAAQPAIDAQLRQIAEQAVSESLAKHTREYVLEIARS